MDKRILYDWSDLEELYSMYTVTEIAQFKGCRWGTVAMQLRKLGIAKFQEQYEELKRRNLKNLRRRNDGVRMVPAAYPNDLTFRYRARAVVRKILVAWGCAPEEIVAIMKNRNVHHKDGDVQNNAAENLMLVTNAEHGFVHRLQHYTTCPHCGKSTV